MHRVAAAAAPGCGAGGCLAVVGVLFELAGEGEATESTAELEKIFGRLPSIAHEDVRCGGGGRVHGTLPACGRPRPRATPW